MTPINFPARFPPLLSKPVQNTKQVHVNEHDWAAHWLVDWLLRIRAWQILRQNFSSERVDSKGFYGAPAITNNQLGETKSRVSRHISPLPK